MTQDELLKLRENAIKHENQTGYPHLDLSHLQYFSEEEIANYEIPNISMYKLLHDRVMENKYGNLIAMEYFGRKITYNEFLNKVDDYAKAFKNLGVEKGEIVSITCPNIPEVFYAIYALNKIGAISNLIDPRNNLERIKHYINEAHSEKLIMLDIVYPKIAKIIDETNLKKVFTVSVSDSLPLGLNYIQSAKTLIENQRKGLPKCPKNDTYQPLIKKVSEYRSLPSEEDLSTNVNVKDNVAIIINTSGTTGTPKGVMLTNENFNALGYCYINTGVDFESGDTFLGIMPNFLAYGMGVGVHMPFLLGLKNVLIPSFQPQEFPKLLLKHKPAHFAGVPYYYQYMMEDKKIQQADLSFIKNPCAGGDSFDPDLKKKVNDFLIAHNCSNKIKVGYGLSENTGMTTSQFYVGESNAENELYSSGIPALYTGIKVVDIDTGKALKVNEDGEILLFGQEVMKGYINNPTETSKVIEEDEGVRYLHTGDFGHVDENGVLYILNRLKRIIVRPDGHNVFPVFIERVVTSHHLVKECVCVGLKDEKYLNGKIPVAFITIEPGFESFVEQIIAELQNMSLEQLPERDVALEYIVIDKIPITENGKVDYPALEAYKLPKEKIRKRI